MIVRDSVSNFIGGVSQQTDKLMYPSQAKTLLNYLPDIVEGLKKRPPTKYVAKLKSTRYIKYPYIHTIIDEDEEYIVILDGSTCQIFDLEGNEKTVEISSAASAYIASSIPLEHFAATTLGNYTFILNKTKTVTMRNNTYTRSYPYGAIVFVKQGNYSTDYRITINDNIVAELTTSDDVASNIKTSTIAANLQTQLQTNLDNNEWAILRKGSTLLIVNRNSHDFTIYCDDSNGNNNLFAFYQEADTSTDLPIVAPNNYILRITQAAKDGIDDYYVQFKTADNSSFGTGAWVECPSPDIPYIINNTTMPMLLVRRANGTFKLDVGTWENRLAGDESTAPNPSFIGQTIQEIMTFKGRLGFISVDKVIFSDVTNIFSFFRKTVLTTLDTDPIDVASNARMVNLKHSLPFNEELVLFSETTQFTIKGGDTFTNSTVSMDLATSYQCSKYCKPISLGANGYFIYENGNYSRVMSLFVTESYNIDAEDVTIQCPSYIGNRVFKLAGSTANHTLVALSQSEQDTLAVYNFYTNGNQRSQSAWSKWQFPNAQVLNADFKQHLLYLVMQYSDGVYLEVMDFTPQIKETNLNYLFHLDRKYYVPSVVYHSSTKKTSFTLPYDVTDTSIFKVINSKGFEYAYTINNHTVSINGNHPDLIIGQTYNSKWVMPIIYVRQSNESGMKVAEGMLMLRDMNLAYANSGYFTVTVTPKYTTQIESKFKFTGMRCGLPSATIGKVSIESGAFLVPLISKNDDITITIENDGYLPSCFLSMEWMGDYVQRGGK